MKIIEQLLPECYLIQNNEFRDNRGSFVKTYHVGAYQKLGIAFDMREEFFSVSKKNVLRGMHFQVPPHDHNKLVYCSAGMVLDVLLDLRIGPNYGKSMCVPLSAENAHAIIIPKGVAHGFLSLSDDSIMVYKTDTVHEPVSDRGILWSSFGFIWPVAENSVIISDRDKLHPEFAHFSSPFIA